MSSPGSDSSGFGSDPVINNRILIIALVILAIVVMFLVSMHFYSRWVWLDSRFTQWDWRWRLDTPLTALQAEAGLDRRLLDALPTFVFTKEATKEAMECSVCLSEFQENETARLLPKCNHCFHAACIDMWLQSHSTCPLCRTKLDEESVSEDQAHSLHVEDDEISLPAEVLSHQPSNNQRADATVEIGSSVADTQIVLAELRFPGGRLRNPDHHLVVDIPSREAINPVSSTPGSTPRPSASSQDQSKASPLSHLRRILTTRETRSAIPASPKSAGVDHL